VFSSHLKFQYWCSMPHWRSKNNGQYAPLLFSSHSGSIADRCLLFHSVFFFASAPFPLFTLPSNEFFLPYVKKPFASRLLVAQSHFTPTNFSLCISLAFYIAACFLFAFFFQNFFSFIYIVLLSMGLSISQLWKIAEHLRQSIGTLEKKWISKGGKWNKK